VCYNIDTVKGESGRAERAEVQISQKKFQKTLDKLNQMCYNKGTVKRGDGSNGLVKIES